MNPPDEVERLINKHQRLVPFFASVFIKKKGPTEWDDLISFGKIGLREAAHRYDPKKGKFSTYASFWITKYFFQAAKEQRELRMKFSFNDRVGHAGDVTRHEVVSDKNAPIPAELMREIVETFQRLIAVAGLNDRERKIILQRYGLDDAGKPKTQKQIAKKLGLTRRRIGQIEKGAREKLEALSPESLSSDFPDFS